MKQAAVGELQYPGLLHRGRRGKAVRRLQEWLCLHGHHIVIDGIFGPATQAALREFQHRNEMSTTGTVTRASFSALVAPMRTAVAPLRRPPKRIGTAVVHHAKIHLAQGAREVGGANRGPWVRLYMNGNDGEAWAWCAGFVCFVLAQACRTLGIDKPFARSFSCDELARLGKSAGRFVAERDAAADPKQLKPGTVFLVRKRPGDWVHTGIVTRVNDDEVFSTIEGNTNEEGSREGYEVCARKRGFGNKDFLIVH